MSRDRKNLSKRKASYCTRILTTFLSIFIMVALLTSQLYYQNVLGPIVLTPYSTLIPVYCCLTTYIIIFDTYFFFIFQKFYDRGISKYKPAPPPMKTRANTSQNKAAVGSKMSQADKRMVTPPNDMMSEFN